MSKDKTDRKDDERLTRGDLAAHVDRAAKVLGDADLAGLARRITAAHEALGLPTSRAPAGLVWDFADNEHESGHNESGHVFEVKPQCVVRASHLVLAPYTAEAYDLLDFKVGKDSQLTVVSVIPLDTFSAAYLHNDGLSKIQEWKGDKCMPGVYMTLWVRRRAGSLAPFRGLLWLDCFW